MIVQVWHSSTLCEIMAFHGGRIEVEKLYGSNYRDRKLTLCVMLKGRGLWKYINGTAIYSVNEDVTRNVLHDKKSDLAHSLIEQWFDKWQYIHIWHTDT